MAPQAIAIRREAESRVGYVQGPRPHEPISDLASHVSGRPLVLYRLQSLKYF